VLNNNQGMYPLRVYVEAIKRAGIRLLLPCVNQSIGPFSVEGEAIRTGLDAVATLDESLKTAIIADRQQHGPYLSLDDFRQRVSPGPESLALLIRCGALDCTGQSRPQLFAEFEMVSRSSKKSDMPATLPFGSRRNGVDEERWSPPDYAIERRLRDEWEILGFAVGAPLMSLFRHRVPADVVSSRDLRKFAGQRVRVAGLVATARTARMEDGRDMQFVTLQDEYGLMEMTLFPGSCPLQPYLRLGPYLVTGMVEEQYDVISVTAEQFEESWA
jgi:DNA polymerase-3 subunit alpha